MSNINIGGFPRISPQIYVAVTVVMVAGATSIALSRLFIQLRRLGRLELHDYFLITAVITLIGSSVFSITVKDMFYYQIYFSYGLVPLRGSDPLGTVATYMRISNALTIVQWISIFSVKFSYVIFFKRFISNLKVAQILWWIVLVALAGSLGAVLTAGLIVCGAPKNEIITKCNGEKIYQRQTMYLQITVVFDIVTDLLIVSIPTYLLVNAKIQLRRKIALFCVLGLSIVMIVIAVIRVAFAHLPGSIVAKSGLTDTVWLFFWQDIEAAVAIIMVSLTAFRGIFGQDKARASSTTNNKRTSDSRTKSVLSNASCYFKPASSIRKSNIITITNPTMTQLTPVFLSNEPSSHSSRRQTPYFVAPTSLAHTHHPSSSSPDLRPATQLTILEPTVYRPSTSATISKPPKSPDLIYDPLGSTFDPKASAIPRPSSSSSLPVFPTTATRIETNNWANPIAKARIAELEARVLEWKQTGKFPENNSQASVFGEDESQTGSTVPLRPGYRRSKTDSYDRQGQNRDQIKRESGRWRIVENIV